MATTLIIIGVIWLCSWVCWEIIHTPSVDKDSSGRSENDPISIWNKYKRGK